MLHDVSHIESYSGNTGSGNGINGFGISGTLVSDGIWSGTFPFVLTGTFLIDAEVILTLDAGTVVKSVPTGLLSVNGTLDANGTPEAPVVFTSLWDDAYGGDTDGTLDPPASGDWYGIQMDGYNSIGQFDWCVVRYGGNTGSVFQANVHFDRSDSGNFIHSVSEYSDGSGLSIYQCLPEITNSTFAHNGSHGLYASRGAPAITDNIFQNNSGYAAMLHDVNLIAGYSGNTGSDNGINGFGINGTLSSDSVLSGTFPFVLADTLSVHDSATLAIEAGTIIKGKSASLLKIKGTLSVNGTYASPVVFTSLKDDTYGGDTDGTADSPASGDWYGIHLCGLDEQGVHHGIGHINWCIIRYGEDNLYFDQSRSGDFTNSVSEHSGSYGVNIHNCSPIFRGSRMENNASYGIYINGGAPNLGNNNLADKGANTVLNNDAGGYQVYSDTSNAINAYYNHWGYETSFEIDSHIYDDNENKEIGKVNFQPWLPEDTSGVVRYHALLIGSGARYNQRDSYLETIAANDAGTVRGFLTVFGLNWSSDRITSLVNEQVSQDAVEDAISEAGIKMDGDDVFLLYYSGHGDSDGLSLFSGHNFSPSDLRLALDSYIPQGAKAIVVLNASHSGIFVSEFDAEARDDTFVLSSCASDEDAPFSGWVSSSPLDTSFFSWHLCQAIAGMGDDDLDLEVSNGEAYDYVNEMMVIGSGDSDHPQSYTASGMGDFPLAKLDLTPEMIIQAFSPVDMWVEDPEGQIVSKDTMTIPSASYVEGDLNGDGDPDDTVIISDVQFGGYSIQIIPESGVEPTATYDLSVVCDGESTILADDVEIQAIPDEPYSFFFSQYNMKPGWNLISIPAQLPDNELEAALQSIAGHYSSVWAYDATSLEWSKYFVNGPDFLNSLETIDPGRGYWIYMDDAAVLGMDGQWMDEAVSLYQGWNLVGYNCLKVKSVTEALWSIAGNYISAWAYDAANSNWERYIAAGAGSLNNLEDIRPGKGYWINAGVDCIWDVNGTAPLAPQSIASGFGGDRISSDRPAMPYTIWGKVEADGLEIASRSIPRVFLKIDGEVYSNCQLETAGRYRWFYALDVPAITGDSAQVELCVQIDGTVMESVPVPSGSPGQILRFDLSAQLSPRVSLAHQNYPNPFNPDTWIPYQLKEDAGVVIKIYLSTGQLVRTLNLGRKAAGFYTDKHRAAYWDGRNEAGECVASGVYFYSVKAGDLTATRKMTILK